jgi:hypothetical protein
MPINLIGAYLDLLIRKKHRIRISISAAVLLFPYTPADNK